jgi:hypothetical protein
MRQQRRADAFHDNDHHDNDHDAAVIKCCAAIAD